jgi:rhodanese-related sulfurtransferase
MISEKIITPVELKSWIDNGKEFQLIDITQQNLLKNLKIQSVWIPVHILIEQIQDLEKDIPVVLCCYVGADSFLLMKILSTEYHFGNVFSLKSGYSGLVGDTKFLC